MDGGCISIWVEKRLTLNQRLLLQKYESFLMDYSLGYSFSYEFRAPEIKTKYERKQIQSKLGFLPEQEIMICGLADPIFRAAEAIMKYFNGYYSHIIEEEDDRRCLNKKCFPIKKRNKIGFPYYAYHIVNWKFIADYFNRADHKKINYLYSLDRFEKNEYRMIWRNRSNYKTNPHLN